MAKWLLNSCYCSSKRRFFICEGSSSLPCRRTNIDVRTGMFGIVRTLVFSSFRLLLCACRLLAQFAVRTRGITGTALFRNSSTLAHVPILPSRASDFLAGQSTSCTGRDFVVSELCLSSCCAVVAFCRAYGVGFATDGGW